MAKAVICTIQKYHPNVTTVEDADKNVVIEVSSDDVAKGKRQDHKECVMAVACKRALNLDGVIAARSTLYLVRGKTATRFIVPESITRELIAFDRGGSFAPGTYQLSKPWANNKLRSHKTKPTKRKGSGRKKLAFRHITDGIRAIL